MEDNNSSADPTPVEDSELRAREGDEEEIVGGSKQPMNDEAASTLPSTVDTATSVATEAASPRSAPSSVGFASTSVTIIRETGR